MTGNHCKLVNAALAGLAVWLAAAPAQAQQRVDMALIPDLDRVEPLIPASGRGQDGDAATRFLWELTSSAGQAAGAGQAAARGRAQLRWGARPSVTRWLAMRSDIDIADAGPDAPTGMVTGRHDLVARLGMDASARGKPGVDAELEAGLEHLGHGRRALERPALGPGPLLGFSATATATLRLTRRAHGVEASGFAFPVSVGMRRIDYLGRHAPVGRAVTRSLSGHLAARMFDRHAVRIDLDLLGIRQDRTEYQVARGVPADATAGRVAAGALGPVPEEVVQTRLEMAKIDLVFFEKDIVVAAGGRTGWMWLSDRAEQRQANLWFLHYGFHIRGEGIGMGLGFGRDGTPAADGRRFVAEYRIETLLELHLEHFGGHVRGAASWLADQEHHRRARDPGVLGRYAVSAEMFHRLGHGMQMGAYHRARYEPALSPRAWDPWAAPRAWDTELGAFMRWRNQPEQAMR